MPYGVNVTESSYDLAEVCSTGLELLFYGYYDEIFGDAADAVKTSLLYTALSATVDGCMYDEAQQRIFEAILPAQSVLLRLMRRLCSFVFIST